MGATAHPPPPSCPWSQCAPPNGSRHLGPLCHSRGEKALGAVGTKGVGGMIGSQAGTMCRTVGLRLPQAAVSHKGFRQGWGPQWTPPSLRCMSGGWGHHSLGAKAHPPATPCPWRQWAPPNGSRHLEPQGHSRGEKAVGAVGTKSVEGMVGFRGMGGHSSGVWVVIGGTHHRGWWGTYFGGGRLTLIL